MIGRILSRYWWMTLLRGAFWILFGIVILARPGFSAVSLALALGLILFVDGILAAGNALRARKDHDDWWVLLLIGLTGIGAGVLTFYNPAATAVAVVFYVAIWAVATGLIQIIGAVRLRKEIKGEFWLILAGLASIVFGLLLSANPGAGALALLWLIGAYALVFGVVLLLLAFRLKGVASHLAGPSRG